MLKMTIWYIKKTKTILTLSMMAVCVVDNVFNFIFANINLKKQKQTNI